MTLSETTQLQQTLKQGNVPVVGSMQLCLTDT